MKRRDFLKTLCILPTVGMMPSLSLATESDTGAGLEKIVTIIQSDIRLKRKVSQSDKDTAIDCARRMNEIIIEAIIHTDAVSDNKIKVRGVRKINKYIFNNYRTEWIEIHGDGRKDGNGGMIRTGYHTIRGAGAKTEIFGKNAVNEVFDGIYHLGFKSKYKHRLVNEDGNKNASFSKIGKWLTLLLAEDLRNGNLS